MSSQIFPLRWKSTGDQWWFASPIDWAAANGHYDLVRELLHLDTNLLIKLTSLRRIRRLETVWDDEDQFKIVAKCRASVAKKLLQECETKGQGPFTGSNSLIRAGYGGWLLYTAASSGDVEFVKELLKRDPLLVFGEGEYGVTDIFYGAGRGKDLEVFRVILDCALFLGGEMEGKGVKGEVSEEFRWEIMNRGVHGAAKGGNVEFLKEILEECDDVLVYRDANGSSILHTASGKGQSEVIKYLLASYDNIIDSTDIHGNTALHVAAYRGHLPVVEILITASPSLALLTNLFGDTFLHMAVSGFQSPGFRRLDHQIKLMKQLLSGTLVDLSEIVNIRNNDGRTALHLAMTGNVESELVELLMTAPLVRINLNTRDSDGKTALDLLKQRPRTASSEFLIKRLISAGGISNSQDRLTRTALVSHLKTQTKGILGSPGASFGIPDAEMFLYAGVNNESDGSCDFATEYTSCSGLESESGSKSEKGLKTLLQRALGENDSGEPKVEYNPIPLRQRFSNVTSFQNNKRVSAQTSLPSPSTKKKYTAGLMHGVIQLMPRSSFGSPKSPFSGSSWASPISKEKRAFSS